MCFGGEREEANEWLVAALRQLSEGDRGWQIID